MAAARPYAMHHLDAPPQLSAHEGGKEASRTGKKGRKKAGIATEAKTWEIQQM